jgi:hypothetical protein
MSSLDLSPIEARILGCLLEKERTIPENYPLSLNSLVSACNQTTNREPVTAYDDKSIEAGISALRDKRLVTVVFGSGSRVQKYRHTILGHFELDRRDVAILCILLLRGPQTAGEIRGRTERLFHFATMEELDACLAALQVGDSPLIRFLPAQPGQKERRYVELMSTEPETGWLAPVRMPQFTQAPEPHAPSRLEALEADLAALRAEVTDLREQLAQFRKQFE